MVSCAVFLLFPLWIHSLPLACGGEELPREAVLSWFRRRVLEDLGLEEPPLRAARGPDGDGAQPDARDWHQRAYRTSRTVWPNPQRDPDRDSSQMILFPYSDSPCSDASSRHLTYYFQPSINSQHTVVTLAHFWFYAGEGATVNSSAPLFIFPQAQRPLQAVDTPSKSSFDGWTTYHLAQNLLAPVAEGPFLLQVHCPACSCHADEPDKMPFLHLHVQPRTPTRSPRGAAATIPWSPSAVNLLQRPSQQRAQHSNCHRAEIDITFEELGWDNWIVYPKVLTFYYCHGNCSDGDQITGMLGITQCCAPVPGTMRSLKITTTSDGGYSFKYETLPNIIPEECTCI
ncbi:inhibin alpha chain [Pholidichthys leucotaenia]